MQVGVSSSSGCLMIATLYLVCSFPNLGMREKSPARLMLDCI